MIYSTKITCIPFQEVFRLELLKSCSQVLPRDHSWAQNIVGFVCSNPRTTLTPIPYSQINCKAVSRWCSASRSSEIRIPTVNSVLPFYRYLLIEPQRPFQPARGSTHTRRPMWACVTGKDRGFSNSVFCEHLTFILKGLCVPGTGPCCEGGF